MIGKYSIKDLEKLSGIKAHTLRIWEQRYGILKPERTDTNIRWYSNDELKMLLNISLLNNHGYKISKIASLTNKQIVSEVNKIVEFQNSSSEQIDGLIISMVEIDEQRFENIISTNILRNGFSHTIENIVYPFLQKIGIMWQTGTINPAQEHFISNLIRQKLIVAIDAQKISETKKSKKILLYLPEMELHEISLLYFAYLLKSKGHQIIYLGQSISITDVQKVVEIRNPDYILSVITQALNDVDGYINQLSKKFPKTPILLSGWQVFQSSKKTPKNIKKFSTASDLLKLV